ncbi:MAG: ATP-binding protein [Alphaproteobacteria bacterium]|nr:ATP-binding protein [Alphaproteobacteria bacterium]
MAHDAVKFTPPGEAVQLSAAATPSGSVRFTVSDRGPGIPADLRDRIFEKFTRGEQPHNRRISGAGLGLNIAKSMVERLNSRISFQNRSGGGTTFVVDLPRRSESQAH